MDHFIDLTYVYLTRSTSQEESLAGKAAFGIMSDTFGFKIKIYHAENGRFSEQPFRSAIEDSNQTKNFFGVRYHHQDVIVERKIQTLTLGARTLLLHAKRYRPEAITTMLWPYSLEDFTEQLNELKLDNDEITHMEKFSGTTREINLKNHHTRGL